MAVSCGLTHGFIRHFAHNGIDCPVKVDFEGKGVKAMKNLPEPVVVNGRYAHVVPGGWVVFGEEAACLVSQPE